MCTQKAPFTSETKHHLQYLQTKFSPMLFKLHFSYLIKYTIHYLSLNFHLSDRISLDEEAPYHGAARFLPAAAEVPGTLHRPHCAQHDPCQCSHPRCPSPQYCTGWYGLEYTENKQFNTLKVRNFGKENIRPQNYLV